MNVDWICRLRLAPKDVPGLHSVLIEGHASIATAIFVLSVSPPKPTGRVVKVTRKARECEAISLVPLRHAIQELFVGQRLAAAIKLASIAIPSENSSPQRLTNSINTLDGEHRFGEYDRVLAAACRALAHCAIIVDSSWISGGRDGARTLTATRG